MRSEALPLSSLLFIIIYRHYCWLLITASLDISRYFSLYLLLMNLLYLLRCTDDGTQLHSHPVCFFFFFFGGGSIFCAAPHLRLVSRGHVLPNLLVSYVKNIPETLPPPQHTHTHAHTSLLCELTLKPERCHILLRRLTPLDLPTVFCFFFSICVFFFIPLFLRFKNKQLGEMSSHPTESQRDPPHMHPAPHTAPPRRGSCRYVDTRH